MREKAWRSHKRRTLLARVACELAGATRLRQARPSSACAFSVAGALKPEADMLFLTTARCLSFRTIEANIMFLWPLRAREGLAQSHAWSEGDVSAEHCL